MWLILTVLCLVVNRSSSQHKDCTVESPPGLYDFSGLSWEPWLVRDLQNTSLDYASVALCNKTHLTPCGVVSICVVDQNNSTWSALESSFIVDEKKNNGEIKVSARLREIDVDTATTITVDVTLMCDDKVGEPHFKNFENKVLYLSWQTVAACTIKNHRLYDNCIINDSKYGKINLRPLRHLLYYTATDKQNKYYVNICGSTVGSVCGNIEDVAGCEIDSANKTQILGFASKQAVKEELYLEFRNKSKKNILKIELVCNPGIPQGKLKFKSDVNSAHIFELETSLACISKLMDCSYQDEDHFKYDLTYLSEMEDTMYHKENATYILSICRSVKHKLCSNGSSVCLINGTSSVSLGTLKYGLEMDGNLRISSSGGDYCNIHNLRYRSVIIFICSNTESLRLANVSLECVYTFIWQTNASCPSVSETGSNCVVRDEALGLDFNLKPLHNPHGSYVIVNENGGSQFDLNVCEELTKPCNGSRNVGVCLTDREGKQYPIGNKAVSPHYKDGRLSFVLKGKGCRVDQMSSTVHITFLCSQSATKSNPEFLGQYKNCTFFFVWHTVLACGQFVAHDCKVSDDKGQTYDLRPLSLPDNDYHILSKTTKGYRKFIINVCRPVIFGNEARCTPQSGVCLQDLTEPNYQRSFTNLGDASGLQYDKDKRVLKVEYKGGLCQNGADAELRSVITFVCDKKENKASLPTLLKESGCLYEFEWKTKLACSKEEETDMLYNNCKLFNFQQGIILDLSLFVAREQIVKSSSGEVFRFVVCGSLNKTNTKGVGVCQEEEGNCVNLGIGNTDLQYEKGRLYLNYTNGANCTANARKYTIIEFICDTKEMLEMTYSSIPCEYTIKWHSNFACVVPCMTDGQRKINLSILSNNENNYKTSINGTSYFISVCKPLIHEEGLNCRNVSAVCKAVRQSERNWSDEVDLGHSQYRPIFLGGNVVLNYSSTSSCANNSSQNLESSIIFACDPFAGFGTPILNHIYLNCKYEFLWNTSVICEDYIFHFASTYSDKILNNSLSNTFINLEPLCRNTKYKVKNYFIHMCDSFLCKIEKVEDQTEISYGRAEYAVFSYSENVTKLFITGGNECLTQSSETYSAVIILTCTASIENQIKILWDKDCTVGFEWRTPAACSHYSESTDHKVITLTNITRSQTSIVAVVVAIILTVIACLVVYVLNKPASRNWCRIKVNRIFSTRHDGEFHYSLRNPDSFELSSAESL